MRFGPPSRRRSGEAGIVPMINIVFLLLVFFLLAATIAPPEPLAVSPPEAAAEGAPPEPGAALHVAADGSLALGEARGEAVFAALHGRGPGPLTLRADAALPGAEFAALLARLAAEGVAEVLVVVVPAGTGPGPAAEGRAP